MKNVTDSGQKVKGQKRLMALERASWILGIDVGKEKLSCALLLKDETFRCRFDFPSWFPDDAGESEDGDQRGRDSYVCP